MIKNSKFWTQLIMIGFQLKISTNEIKKIGSVHYNSCSLLTVPNPLKHFLESFLGRDNIVH